MAFSYSQKCYCRVRVLELNKRVTVCPCLVLGRNTIMNTVDHFRLISKEKKLQMQCV